MPPGARVAFTVSRSREMEKELSIFGLRFNSNADLNPTRQELGVFLESTAKPGSRVLHQSDLARYSGLLEGLLAFERRERPDGASQDIRAKMFYAVLDHSQFVTPGLKLAVEQFKYHLHDLASIDLVKPAAFIRTAQAEMGRLNPKRKDEAARLARLTGMVEERKRLLDALVKRRPAVVEELCNIARYVRDNLAKIEKRCKRAVAILVDPQVSQQKEKQLIDDIKERFKEELKDSLRNGSLSRKDLEAAKRDVGVLAGEVSSLLRDDVGAMIRLYEAVHHHVRQHFGEIDRMLAEIGNGKDRSAADDLSLFRKLEGALVSLVSNYRFELRTAALRSETAHEHVLHDTRHELLLGLSALLERDRRSRFDRRAGGDRRRSAEPSLHLPERRKGRDRRSGKGRRLGPSES
jgi:hypothetical protein